MSVSASSVSNSPVGFGRPFSSISMRSTVNVVSSISLIVRSQWIITPSSSASLASKSWAGISFLVRLIDDHRLIGTKALDRAGDIHGRVAAAIDDDPSAELRGLGRGFHLAQDGDGVEDLAGGMRRDRCARLAR